MPLAPPREWSRLQKLVFVMRQHGNEPKDASNPNGVDIDVLAKHNGWTDAEAIRAEWKIQQNGSRRLPEEVAANAPPPPVSEEIEE